MRTLKRNLLAVPILVWIGLLVGVPMIFVVVLSFLSRDNLGNIIYQFTLDNYRRVVDPIYLRVFWNSLLLALLTALITLVVGYPVAYITANLSPTRRALSLGLIMLPFWISSVLRTYGWMILLGNAG